MASSSSGHTPEMASLLRLTRTSSALITHFLTTLSAARSTTGPSSAVLASASLLPAATLADPPNPLQVLRDAALLLKSHATKLGLLLLNKPFTPSAVERVLRDITGTCLPAMISAVELAVEDAWGALLRAEIVARVRRAVVEAGVCVEEVRAVAERAVSSGTEGTGRAGAGGGGGGGGRDTLASTGVVWAACDALAELEELDVGGVALLKARQYKALLADALAELKEWGETGDEEDGGDEEDKGRFSDEEAEDEEDDIFGADKLPRDRPELKAALEDATGKIKKVDILFTALVKRRIKPFTKDLARYQVLVVRMDSLVADLKGMVEATDDVAAALYDLDEAAVQARVADLVQRAHATIKLVRLSWNDAEDEFTAWSAKWVEAVR